MQTETALPRIGLVLAFLFAALGIAYLISKSFLSSDPEVDLKYIWVAGRLWADGINPYTEAFATIGDTFFENTNTLDSWLYPPNWWGISWSLSLFDPETATVIWRGLNAILLCAGVILVIQGLKADLAAHAWLVLALVLGYATTMQATPQVLSIGQTSIMLSFGVCSVMYGLLTGRSFWIVLGLLFVALKPQAGLVVFAALAALPSLWRPILYAILITFLLCVPAFLSVGVLETVRTVLGVYLSYDGALEVNSAANTTGIRHIIEMLTGADVSSLGMSLLGSIIAFGLAFWLQRLSGGDQPARGLAILIPVVLVAFVSFHTYDFVIVAPLLALVFVSTAPLLLRVTFGLALLAIYRSGNLAEATGWLHPDTLFLPGSQIASIAAMAMFAAVCVCLLQGRLPIAQISPAQS